MSREQGESRNMSRPPADQFDYVFLKHEGNKGVSYKYSWGNGTWRLPPGVKPLRVFLGVSFWLSLAAFPVFAWPYLRPKADSEKKAPPNVYAVIKVSEGAAGGQSLWTKENWSFPCIGHRACTTWAHDLCS